MDEAIEGFVIGLIFGIFVTTLIVWEIVGRAWEREAIELGYGEMILKDKFSEFATFEWKKPSE